MARNDFKKGKADVDDGFVPVAKLLHIGLDNISDLALRKVAGKIARSSYGNFDSKEQKQRKTVNLTLHDFSETLGLSPDKVAQCLVKLIDGFVVASNFDDKFSKTNKRFKFEIQTDVSKWVLPAFDAKHVMSTFERERLEFTNKGSLNKINKITGREMSSILDVMTENKLGFVPEFHKVMLAYKDMIENLKVGWKDFGVKINVWVNCSNAYFKYLNRDIDLAFCPRDEVEVEQVRNWIMDRLALEEVSKARLPLVEGWLRDKYGVESKSQQQTYKTLFLDFSWLQAIHDIPTHKILANCVDERDVSENLFGMAFKSLVLQKGMVRDMVAHLGRVLSGGGEHKRAVRGDDAEYTKPENLVLPAGFTSRKDGSYHTRVYKIGVSGDVKIVDDCPFKLALAEVKKEEATAILNNLGKFESLHFCPKNIDFCSLEFLYVLNDKSIQETNISIGFLSKIGVSEVVPATLEVPSTATEGAKTEVHGNVRIAEEVPTATLFSENGPEQRRDEKSSKKQLFFRQRKELNNDYLESEVNISSAVDDSYVAVDVENDDLTAMQGAKKEAYSAVEDSSTNVKGRRKIKGVSRTALGAPEDPPQIKSTTYSKKGIKRARAGEAGQAEQWLHFAGGSNAVMSELRAAGNELILAPRIFKFNGENKFPINKSTIGYANAIMEREEKSPEREETLPTPKSLSNDSLELPDPVESGELTSDFKIDSKAPSSPIRGLKPPTPTHTPTQPKNVYSEEYINKLAADIMADAKKPSKRRKKWIPDAHIEPNYFEVIPGKLITIEELGLKEYEEPIDGVFRTLVNNFDPLIYDEKISKIFTISVVEELLALYRGIPFHSSRRPFETWLSGFSAHAKCVWKVIQDFSLNEVKTAYKEVYLSRDRNLITKDYKLDTFCKMLIHHLHELKEPTRAVQTFVPQFLDPISSFDLVAHQKEHDATKNEENKYNLSEILGLTDEMLMQSRYSYNLKTIKGKIDLGDLPDEVKEDKELTQFCMDVGDGKYSSLMPAALRAKLFKRLSAGKLKISHFRHIAEFYPLLIKMGAYVLPPEYYPDKFPLLTNEMAVKNACNNIKSNFE